MRLRIILGADQINGGIQGPGRSLDLDIDPAQAAAARQHVEELLHCPEFREAIESFDERLDQRLPSAQ